MLVDVAPGVPEAVRGQREADTPVHKRSRELLVTLRATQIDVDSARLRQIIVNGLTNAIKYAGAGASCICVAARRDARAATITFSVIDDGDGLPAGVSEEELFTDFNGAGAKMAGSSGLGLPICCRCDCRACVLDTFLICWTLHMGLTL